MTEVDRLLYGCGPFQSFLVSCSDGIIVTTLNSQHFTFTLWVRWLWSRIRWDFNVIPGLMKFYNKQRRKENLLVKIERKKLPRIWQENIFTLLFTHIAYTIGFMLCFLKSKEFSYGFVSFIEFWLPCGKFEFSNDT